jgi:hypothetical protein
MYGYHDLTVRSQPGSVSARVRQYPEQQRDASQDRRREELDGDQPRRVQQFCHDWRLDADEAPLPPDCHRLWCASPHV